MNARTSWIGTPIAVQPADAALHILSLEPVEHYCHARGGYVAGTLEACAECTLLSGPGAHHITQEDAREINAAVRWDGENRRERLTGRRREDRFMFYAAFTLLALLAAALLYPPEWKLPVPRHVWTNTAQVR